MKEASENPAPNCLPPGVNEQDMVAAVSRSGYPLQVRVAAELRPHDLRRSAARNLRKLGVPESVIMKLCGWKTRAMFERYNIVDASDVSDAIAKLAALDTTPGPRRVLRSA